MRNTLAAVLLTLLVGLATSGARRASARCDVKSATANRVVAVLTGANVHVCTLDGTTVEHSVDLGEEAACIAWCPSLESFLVAAGRTVWAVTFDGRSTRVGEAREHIRSIGVAPSGDLVALVTESTSQAVSIYAIRNHRLRLLGGGVESWRQPQRVEWGDLDGDGRVEALVLVYGRARFDHRLALRPFVYGWDGARLFPRWLGSRLSHPFDDATLGDVDGDGRAELIAVEATRSGERELAAYSWRGFGFERFATSDSYERLCRLSFDPCGRILAVANGFEMIFRVIDRRITPNAGL